MKFRVFVRNMDDLQALHDAHQLVRELRERYPWDNDIAAIDAKLDQVGKGLKVWPASQPPSSDSTP